MLCLFSCQQLHANSSCDTIEKTTLQMIEEVHSARYYEALKRYAKLQQGGQLQRCEDPAPLGNLYLTVATAFTMSVVRDSAIKYLELSLQLSTTNNLPDIKYRASSTYAMLLNQLGAYERALALFREVYRGQNQLTPKDFRRKAINTFNIGLTFQNLRQPDSALVYLQQSLSFADKADFAPIKPNIFGLLSTHYLQAGDFEQAKRYVDAALGTSQQKNNREQMVQGWLLQADLLTAQQQRSAALASIDKAKQLMKGDHFSLLHAQIYKKRYQLLFAMRDSLSGLRDLLKYQQIRDTLDIRNRDAQRESLSNMLQIAEEKYALEKRLVQTERARLIQRYSLALLLAVVVVILVLFRLYYVNVRNKSLLFKINLNKRNQQQLANHKHEDIFYQAVDLVEKEKLYLDPDMSIAQLARMLGTNEKYLSNAIKTGSGDNFKAFINRYRISSIKQRIEDAILSGDPLTRFSMIGEECGFKNESTFYRVFKEETGMAPKEYAMMLKQHLNL
jgi:AraC-like DNA-binding protein